MSTNQICRFLLKTWKGIFNFTNRVYLFHMFQPMKQTFSSVVYRFGTRNCKMWIIPILHLLCRLAGKASAKVTKLKWMKSLNSSIASVLRFLWWWGWWWWIFFVVWLTNEGHLALFTVRTILREPHHCKSVTLHEQDLNLRRTWVEDLLSEVVE